MYIVVLEGTGVPGSFSKGIRIVEQFSTEAEYQREVAKGTFAHDTVIALNPTLKEAQKLLLSTSSDAIVGSILEHIKIGSYTVETAIKHGLAYAYSHGRKLDVLAELSKHAEQLEKDGEKVVAAAIAECIDQYRNSIVQNSIANTKSRSKI